MTEIREKLKPFVNKRIKVRGTLSAFRDWMKNYRDVRRACISDPEMAGEVLAHHVWVLEVAHWPETEVGKQVEFSAVVKPYTEIGGTCNYCLGSPDELVVLHQPPALKIPDAPEEDEMPPEGSTAEEEPICPDPLERFRQAKAFVHGCGGPEQAARSVKAMQIVTMPLPELEEWIKALMDE